MSEWTLWGNFNLAGTNKFITHLVAGDGRKTLCGLNMMKRRGDWQETSPIFRKLFPGDIGCLKCKDAYLKLPEPPSGKDGEG